MTVPDQLEIRGRGAIGHWLVHFSAAGRNVEWAQGSAGSAQTCGVGVASHSNLGWLLGGSYAAFLHVLLSVRGTRGEELPPDLFARHQAFATDLAAGAGHWLRVANDEFERVPVFYRLPVATWDHYQSLSLALPDAERRWIDANLQVEVPLVDQLHADNLDDPLPADASRPVWSKGPFVVLRAVKGEHVHRHCGDWRATLHNVIADSPLGNIRGGTPHVLRAPGASEPHRDGDYHYHRYGIVRHDRARPRFWLGERRDTAAPCIEVVAPTEGSEWHAFRRHFGELGFTDTVVAAGRNGSFARRDDATDWCDAAPGTVERHCEKLHRENPMNGGAGLARYVVADDGSWGHTEFTSLAPVVAELMLQRAVGAGAPSTAPPASTTRSPGSAARVPSPNPGLRPGDWGQ